MLWAVVASILIVLATGVAHAEEPKPQPEKITCDDVREFVAANGRAHALAIALRNGATAKQIREAARCLKR
jgi:hypothetical protein